MSFKNHHSYLTSILALGVFTVLLLLASKFLFQDTMDKYPTTIHAWTQSDRIAIAQNFQSNGFDFFHPSTYNLLTKDGITQVDFPIHDYLVAILSSTFNSTIVTTFRWYNFLYSILGFIFLFNCFLALRNSYPRAYFGTFFIFTLPFLVYYLNGFLPSIPSLANFYIGIYFLIHSKKTNSPNKIWLSSLFITLAALGRSPFVVFLFAMIINNLYHQKKKGVFNIKPIAPYVLGFAFFLIYWAYNVWLGKTYGSMFLNESLHFNSFDQLVETLSIAWDRWAGQWFSAYHFFSILLLFSCYFYFSRYRLRQDKFWSEWKSYIWISLIGVFIFFFALGQQFGEHDYYYIDSFLPIAVLILLYVLSRLEIPQLWYTPLATVCALFVFYFFSSAKEIQSLRYTPPFNDRIDYATRIYIDSKNDFANWGIEETDTLYVIEANSTNIPFTIWNNKGYTNLYSRPDTLIKELQRDFTYAVLVDSFFRQTTFKDYPELLTKLKKVNSNGELSIYQKQKEENPALFVDRMYHFSVSNFDDQNGLSKDQMRGGIKQTVNDSLGQSLLLQSNSEFPLSIKTHLIAPLEDRPLRMHIVGDFYQTDTANYRLVCSVNNFYKSHYTESHLKKNNQWYTHQFDFKIGAHFFEEGDEVKLYFWNPQKKELIVDNLNILIYQ